MNKDSVVKVFYLIFRELFWFSWIAFAVFYLIDLANPGLISNMINPAYLLLVVFLFAIATAFLEPNKSV